MIRRIYDRLLKEQLPRQIGAYNSISLRRSRILDSRDLFTGSDYSHIKGVVGYGSPDDRVVIVDGGYDCSTVSAAKASGKDVAIEGGEERIDLLEDIIIINGVGYYVDIRHAMVGPAINVYSSSVNAENIQTEELPDCDFLILNCEGTEAFVIERMTFQADHFSVEVHSNDNHDFGIDPKRVYDPLEDLNYEIDSRYTKEGNADVPRINASIDSTNSSN